MTQILLKQLNLIVNSGDFCCKNLVFYIKFAFTQRMDLVLNYFDYAKDRLLHVLPISSSAIKMWGAQLNKEVTELMYRQIRFDGWRDADRHTGK